jgi:hypothetical protein
MSATPSMANVTIGRNMSKSLLPNNVWRTNVRLAFSVPKDWKGRTHVYQDERDFNGSWKSRLIYRVVDEVHPDFAKAIDEHFVRPALYALSDIAVMKVRKHRPKRRSDEREA